MRENNRIIAAAIIAVGIICLGSLPTKTVM